MKMVVGPWRRRCYVGLGADDMDVKIKVTIEPSFDAKQTFELKKINQMVTIQNIK
jgi:hypothetical protein